MRTWNRAPLQSEFLFLIKLAKLVLHDQSSECRNSSNCGSLHGCDLPLWQISALSSWRIAHYLSLVLMAGNIRFEIAYLFGLVSMIRITVLFMCVYKLLGGTAVCFAFLFFSALQVIVWTHSAMLKFFPSLQNDPLKNSSQVL